MLRTGYRIGAVLLLALAAEYLIAGRGENEMKSAVFASERPAIDRVVPSKLETATFALG